MQVSLRRDRFVEVLNGARCSRKVTFSSVGQGGRNWFTLRSDNSFFIRSRKMSALCGGFSMGERKLFFVYQINETNFLLSFWYGIHQSRWNHQMLTYIWMQIFTSHFDMEFKNSGKITKSNLVFESNKLSSLIFTWNHPALNKLQNIIYHSKATNFDSNASFWHGFHQSI